MTYQRLAYDDQDTTPKMAADCTACASQMGIPARPITTEALTEPAVGYSRREIPKPEITVSDATAFFVSRLHLHLD